MASEYEKEAAEVRRWMTHDSEACTEPFSESGFVTIADGALAASDPDVWINNINSYFNRVGPWLNEALTLRLSGDDPEAQETATELEKMAQQAICKALMASKAFAESAVRCFGALPAPGKPSGYVEPWEWSLFHG